MGPTVCELDGPMPVLKRSQTRHGMVPDYPSRPVSPAAHVAWARGHGPRAWKRGESRAFAPGPTLAVRMVDWIKRRRAIDAAPALREMGRDRDHHRRHMRGRGARVREGA